MTKTKSQIETASKPAPAKPIAKPILKPRQEIVEELAEDSGAIFQAVGILPGSVAFDNPGASITVEGKKYPLYYSTEHRSAFGALKLNVKATGSSQRLIVHPHIRHFPKREDTYQVGFQVVGFIGRQPVEGCISEELPDFEFRIAGLWQFIPVCPTPCITVFKNFSEERLVFVKEATVEDKVRFMKASHIPLLWKQPPVKPFRFNPRLDKEKQGKAPFVQVTARFLPERDAFEFSAMRSLPATNPPKFLKAGKKDKADAIVQNKKKETAKR